MKSRIVLSSLILATALFTSCRKDSLMLTDGIYKGEFTVTYPLDKHGEMTTVEFKDGRYKCTGNPSRFPAGGSGSYTFTKNTITFNDENFWTADFDGNLVLNGVYEYKFDGKKLKLLALRNDIGKYEYQLEKQ